MTKPTQEQLTAAGDAFLAACDADLDYPADCIEAAVRAALAARPELTAPEAVDRAARALSMDDGNAPEHFDRQSESTRADVAGRALLVIEAAMGTRSLADIAAQHGYTAGGAS